MAGCSYFEHDEATLLRIEVPSDELEVLRQAADEEVRPKAEKQPES